jgi:hypothetical protein
VSNVSFLQTSLFSSCPFLYLTSLSLQLSHFKVFTHSLPTALLSSLMASRHNTVFVTSSTLSHICVYQSGAEIAQLAAGWRRKQSLFISSGEEMFSFLEASRPSCWAVVTAGSFLGCKFTSLWQLQLSMDMLQWEDICKIWACSVEIHPADSAGWRLKQCSISPAAARHWLDSAIIFLGDCLLNQKK